MKRLKIQKMIFFVAIACFANAQTKTFNPIQGFQNPFTAQVKTTSITALGKIPAPISKDTFKIKPEQESFFTDVAKYGITKDAFEQNMNTHLGLNSDFTFITGNTVTDDLGFTHVRYDQYYKALPVDAKMCLAHFKNGILRKINGQIANFNLPDVTPTITEQKAFAIAKEYLKAEELIQQYPIELLLTKSLADNQYHLAFKVRIDANKPTLQMKNVFIEAKAGDVINVIELMNDADATGTAQTLYSGTQTITTDNFGGGYRLRESGRKIQTFNATNATGVDSINGFLGSSDLIDADNNWTGIPILNSVTISSVATTWWYAAFADEVPDLYIKVYDASNNLVWGGNAYRYNDINPPISFSNLNIAMTNPPYSVQIWDYDPTSGDDYGGIFNINQTGSGNYSWVTSGNSGSIAITNSGNLATDVHWGMEKTYDFYLNVFGRNSFNGLGSTIKNFINPPNMQSINGGDPKNAGALPSPYNIMQYGLGDGATWGPVVGLDVEGHEYTHMVVNYNGNGGLTYQRESGALNESFADIFGTCVESYSGVNPDWTIGEGVILTAPFYLRSMSNPNSGQQPDTYNGSGWQNPNCGIPTFGVGGNDGCGVHGNSGVQNFWFYLLCQGGSATNDLNNAYTVSGIGIAQARQIAYRNLTTYLTPNATYMDAYNGSLQAADDLYGYNSTQYNAVRAAWYAVGIGTAPVINATCSGTTYLTANSGTISDGSSTANYSDNLNCKWVIAPSGATQIFLNFTGFDLENGFDTVFIYAGTDTTGIPYPITGTSLLSLQTQPGTGAALIKFKTDGNTNATGWTLNYTSIGVTPTCDGGSLLKTPTGNLDDGSGAGNYANNQLCYWFIAPPCATSVTLNVTTLNTELGRDGIIVYDGDNTNAPVLLNTSGTTLPGSITSSGGKMLVVFISDYVNPLQGFAANYTSTGSNYCATTTTYINDAGTFSDGSGSNTYCNNADCTWLIQPAQATSVTLNFSSFDLENASSDGLSLYDAVEVYDGVNTNAPLLGRFSGSGLPPSVNSTGGSMFVRFYTNYDEQFQGFTASYTSTTNNYCTGTTTLTAASGFFVDGSGTNQYGNNADCNWLIQPANAGTITLSFLAFNTEPSNDGIIIYDGPNENAQVLAFYSGTSIPAPITSTQGSMFVKFVSNPSIHYDGWVASYTSTSGCSSTATATANGSTTFCQGGSVLLTANTGSSYQWKKDGIDIFGANSITYSAIQSGSYTVAVTPSGCPANTSAPVVVTVNPVPAPNITANGATAFCQGGQVVLSVSGTYVSYNWSNGIVAATQTVSNSSTYAVTVTDNNGCTGSSSFLSVVVNPNPIANAGNDVTIAQGSSTILTANGGVNYAWSNGGNTQSISVSPFSTTTYTVTVTDANGCSATDNVLVTVTNSCANSSLSNINQNVPASGGSYTVNLTIGAGCNWGVTTGCLWTPFQTTSGTGSASIPFTVQPNTSVQRICSLYIHGTLLFTVTQEAGTTDIDEVALLESINIYPNPASNELFIESNNVNVTGINIYNATGSLVSQTKLMLGQRIDIGQLAIGVYVAEIKVGNVSVKRRWVKM